MKKTQNTKHFRQESDEASLLKNEAIMTQKEIELTDGAEAILEGGAVATVGRPSLLHAAADPFTERAAHRHVPLLCTSMTTKQQKKMTTMAATTIIKAVEVDSILPTITMQQIRVQETIETRRRPDIKTGVPPPTTKVDREAIITAATVDAIDHNHLLMNDDHVGVIAVEDISVGHVVDIVVHRAVVI